MRRLMMILALSLTALLIAHAAPRAAHDDKPPRGSGVELLVFEHPDCLYCRVFRRDVVPQYQEGTQAQRAPMRFIDLQKSSTDGLGLNAHISTVPTAVLVKNGREVDRIVGYWSPDNFFKMLAYMLTKADAIQ
jgi:thioredoxin-related protein